MSPKQRRIRIALTTMLLAAVLSACGAKDSGLPEPSASASSPPFASETAPPSETAPSPSGSEGADDLIVEEFRKKGLAGAPADEMFAELKEFLAVAQPAQADELIRALDEYYEKELPETQKAYEEEAVQRKLSELERPVDEAGLAKLEDGEVRELAERTLAGGYKLETAEGFIFPIVDYGKLAELGDNLSIAMQTYLDLMAMESDAPSAKDAALVISRDELAARTLAAESYVVTFPDTPERKKAEEAYFRYLSFYFIGLNNTPVFDYETFAIEPEAKAQYEQMAASHGGTIVGRKAAEWLAILEETNGQVFTKGQNGEQTDIPSVKAFRDSLESTVRAELPAAKNQ